MRILILEDSRTNRLLLSSYLERGGHTVESVENGRQGFLLATSNQYDLFISDIVMPQWDGFKFIEAMEVVCPRMPIIVVSSAYPEAEIRKRVGDSGNVIAIIPKPCDLQHLDSFLQGIKAQTSDSVKKMARIVCTIGPASDSPETLGRMILAGMDVARLNFSHGSHDQHGRTLKNIRDAEEEWGKPIAVLQDLCGPKIRTGVMTGEGVELSGGQSIRIVGESVEGDGDRFSTITPEILPDLQVGDKVLLDDGLMELKVTRAGEHEVECRVVVGGVLKSNKGMNLPMTTLSLPSITDKDRADLEWGLNHSVDYVALSFVRSPEEIRELKDIIGKSKKRDLRVIAKIEKPEAVENIVEIIEEADAIMIARGDMGVELPAAKVPRIQQEIIRKCWERNTPVITATQMLDTMTYNSRPTRAEVTDVSVAVKGGTDAVMLSGETATGSDPVNVVRTMASIICEEERFTELDEDHFQLLMEQHQVSPALLAASTLNNASATMLLDAHGILYPNLSRWNRQVPSLLVTKSLHVARHASLYKNIVPLIIREKLGRDEMVFEAIYMAKEWGYLNEGDMLAVVEGGRLTQGGILQLGAFQLIQVE
ncbi:MAG: pyruvate kinase [Thermodesulfobacteriota bacterium]